MTRIPVLALSAAALTLSAILTACGAGDRAPAGSWAGSVDTLANGAIRIRNPSTGLWDEATTWRIEEELRIGTVEEDGPDLFGQINDLAVDDRGYIYVLEGQARAVRVFGPDGQHIRTIGRTGSGPGEFRLPIGLRWDAAGRLWVVDAGNARYAIFDTAGAYQTMVRRTTNFTRLHWPGGFDPAGRLFDTAILPGEGSASASSPGVKALIAFRVDAPDPVPADTIRIPQYEGPLFEALNERGQRSMSIPVPFTPQLVWHFEPRGALWTAITGDYQIARIDIDGDTTRVVKRDFRPAPVTADDREQALATLDWFAAQGGRVDPSRIPSTKPAIHSLFTDSDGYLWVQPVTTTEDQGYLVDLFDPDGRYLGEIRLPFKLGSLPPVIIGDRLYAVTRDEMEVQYVVRARIVGKGEQTPQSSRNPSLLVGT